MTKLFDPEKLHSIAKEVVGLPNDKMFTELIAKLDAAYPGRINTKVRWIFNNAGGAMGQMTILYGSITEYLIIFGTPIGTEGHSGRYSSEVYDFMIEGEMWTYYQGDTVRTVYKPGDAAHLASDKVKGYCVKDHAWMLEYGRGFIPTMMPFGLADSIFSTLDYKNFFYTIWDYGRLCVRELLRGKF